MDDDEKAFGCLFIGLILLSAIISVVVTGVVVWAIIRAVLHLT